MTAGTAEIEDVRKKALDKFHEQVRAYPDLLLALSTENLANLVYDRERSGLGDNDMYVREINKRLGGGVWEQLREEGKKQVPPAWGQAIKTLGADPQKRLRQQ